MMTGVMKKMSGKKSNTGCGSFEELYLNQAMNQLTFIKKGKYDSFTDENVNNVPVDDPKLCSYHIQQLISEIGEVLDADKRWKNFRNDKYNRDDKLYEIADCFIVLMNVAMFSGFSSEEVANAIAEKIRVVKERIEGQ